MSNVVIIGAGAAGLMSGIIAARNGNKVTILEQCDKPCKKIYATGNGRCNFTNLIFDENSYKGEDASFAYDALKTFSNEDLIAFFKELGLLSKDINGYVYPNSEQAKAVPACLLSEAKRLGIKIYSNTKVIDFNYSCDQFNIRTTQKEYHADKLIITVGGMASPKLGSDGSLFSAIMKTGHSFSKTVPALTSLIYNKNEYYALKGVRYKCDIILKIDNSKAIYKNKGEIIFNTDNINGIPIMQLSRYASYGFEEGKNVELSLDLLPEFPNNDSLYKYLSNIIYGELSFNKTILDILYGLLNDKLADYIIKKCNIDIETQSNEITTNQLHKIVNMIKSFDIKIKGVSSFENAQVMAGGIKTKEIDANMQSKLVKNLYFAGEVIDIDGNCGGYNLQWAFTSGYIAGLLK